MPDGATDTVLDRIVLVDGLSVVEFTPYPFGHDLFAQFGDEYAAPIVGNFDPPVAGTATDPPSDTLTLQGTALDDTFEVVRRRSRAGGPCLETASTCTWRPR